MAKQKSHVVSTKQKKDPLHCGTITREDLMRMDRAARRQDEIDSGIRPSSGTGAHGGNKHQRKRKDRREGKQDVRRQMSDC